MPRNPYKMPCAREGCKNYARDGMRFCQQHLSPQDRERADRLQRLKEETYAAQLQRDEILAEFRPFVQPELDESRIVLPPPLPEAELGAQVSRDPETLLRFTEGALDSCRRGIEWLNRESEREGANPVVIADQIARLTQHMVRILHLRHQLEQAWYKERSRGI